MTTKRCVQFGLLADGRKMGPDFMYMKFHFLSKDGSDMYINEVGQPPAKGVTINTHGIIVEFPVATNKVMLRVWNGNLISITPRDSVGLPIGNPIELNGKNVFADVDIDRAGMESLELNMDGVERLISVCIED